MKTIDRGKPAKCPTGLIRMGIIESQAPAANSPAIRDPGATRENNLRHRPLNMTTKRIPAATVDSPPKLEK